jgi:cytoskeletal protein CcmA (bactofilin family)
LKGNVIKTTTAGEHPEAVECTMGLFGKPTSLNLSPVNLSPVTEKEAPMLSMGKKELNEYERSDFEQSSAARETSRGGNATSGEKTIIGEHISIEGTIRADEDIVIEGNVKGSIEVKSHQLTVGSKGKVEADVDADSVVIGGRMVGNVTARNKVQVMKNADFSGQIKAKRIAVEDGAFVKASIELEKDEKSQQHQPMTQKSHGGGITAAPVSEPSKIQKPDSAKV